MRLICKAEAYIFFVSLILINFIWLLTFFIQESIEDIVEIAAFLAQFSNELDEDTPRRIKKITDSVTAFVCIKSIIANIFTYY